MAKKPKAPAVVTLASVHRFRDKVAVYAGRDGGGTLYLSADDALHFGAAIIAAAESVKRESFLDSNVPNFHLTEGEESKA